MELPINIVVMLVVGMVALAALLAIIPEAKENLEVDLISVYNNNGSTANVENGIKSSVDVIMIVYDRDNNPVEGASIIISGGGSMGSNKTDATGQTTVTVPEVLIRINQDSIYLKMVAKANGFYDYSDETAILLT
ncbi:MAG TPA: carboxypeptidase regulatory-like domain-containing protein [Candidatus Nanoarchaeia archaeon]|nr:carboxypeptidase regulatory-like domain-containing protein [Candidatus Nanoarchaeia archaeon]